MSDNKLLTPLELKVMNALWKLKKAFVKDILEVWPSENDGSKPAYNTVSTTVRILETKGYIKHDAFGRTHRYYPVVSRASYQKRLISNVLDNAFGGSARGLVSALMDNDKVGEAELDEIQSLIDQNKNDE